jgi:tetratricopeptide (TPR) repeat protein
MALDIREQVQASLGDSHTIERELGGGGMSRTFVSLERARARRVVIKVLSAGERGLQRMALDSVPLIDRDYQPLLQVAAQLGDTARARRWSAEYKAQLKELGRVMDGAALGEVADASLAIARGKFDEAWTHLQSAERQNVLRPDLVGPTKFMVLNRLQNVDSAIAAGEAYAAITYGGRLPQDALFLANTHQRLGELYEQKGNVDKALEHYNAFVQLWKDADPELQPRVRDVRGRIERLRRGRG